MCGRFSLSEPSLLKDFYNVQEFPGLRPNYNCAPGHSIPIIRLSEGRRIIERYHWGLIPSWAKDKKVGYKMINARGETIQEKPSFRSAFKKNRCIIPACGFFEWRKEGTTKQPYRIFRNDSSIISMAGLFEHHGSPRTGKNCRVVRSSPPSRIH